MTGLLLSSIACWAPDRDPVLRAPEGDRQEEHAAPAAPPTPALPFSAWTSSAPTSIVGPGGETLALLEQAGVRVEVLRVLPHRMLLRCTGCAGPSAGVEGWLQNEFVWWPGASELPEDHPLRRAQELRGRWAAGLDLPPGTDADALCALLDGGYQGAPPRFTVAGASLTLPRAVSGWLPPQLEGQPPPAPGACQR